ncbi:MAG: hypothetical protein C0506_01695 [Anaerolinea sp.]|nr:hypothetical protein [Anaerolinea sp.]
MSRLALPVAGERFRLEAGESEADVTVVRLADGLSVGRFELERDDGTITVRSLCIDEAERSYGAGSEAALLLVRAAEQGGFRRIRAWAHPKLGLSAYFWGRMGLRPLHGPGPEGGIWYERAK